MAPRHAQIPETIPGTEEELAAIASDVVRGGSGDRRHVDRARLDRVTAQLHRIASVVLADLQQQVKAPSAKQLEARLERISRLSQQLSDELRSLPKFSLHFLNLGYRIQRAWDDTAKTFVSLGLGSAPVELVASAINAAAKQELESWRDGRILGLIPPSRPGQARAFERLVGDPRVFLADQVAQLIAQERGPAAVTEDVKGPVYDVVARLWTFATGLPEEGANLRHYVRRGVRSAVILAERQIIQHQIDEELRGSFINNTIYIDHSTGRVFRNKLEFLQKQVQLLSAQAHAALWDYDADTRLDSPSAEGESRRAR